MSSPGSLLRRMGGVDVLSWNPVRSDEGAAGERLVDNFGDLLGPALVERMVGFAGLGRVDRVDEARVLVSVGSVMHLAPHRSVVWGTGVNFKVRKPLPRGVGTLDIRAVRGPLTARTLVAEGIAVPGVFGDPALLLPRYMPEFAGWSRDGEGGLLVVPNLNDYPSTVADAEKHGLATLNPQAPLSFVLRTIAQSGFVLGSSLHAVVIADALGIPARFVSSAAEHAFKYRDYLAGTGRPLARVAPDLSSAIEMGGHEPLDVDLDALAAAFPHDLWGAERVDRPSAFLERQSIIAAWSDTVAAQPPDIVSHAAHFVDEVLPTLCALADAVIAQGVGETEDSEINRAYEDAYDAALAFRLALTFDLRSEELSDRAAAALAGIDAGSPDALLRSLWLLREGPHALVRHVRANPRGAVVSMVVRPGRLSNEIVSIDVCFLAAGKPEIARRVPVFAQHRRQWTIDVTVGLGADFALGTVTADVVLTSEGGGIAALPVRQVSPAALSLAGYPRVQDADAWVYGVDAHSPARPATEGLI